MRDTRTCRDRVSWASPPGDPLLAGWVLRLRRRAYRVSIHREVVEFIAAGALPEADVGGYEDTGRDLSASTVGSLAAVLIYARDPGQPKGSN